MGPRATILESAGTFSEPESTARADASESSTALRRLRRLAISALVASRSGLSSATITVVTAPAAMRSSTTTALRIRRACHLARSKPRVRAPGVGGTSSTRHGRCSTGTLRARGFPACAADLGTACAGDGGVVPRMGITPVTIGAEKPPDGTIGVTPRGVAFDRDITVEVATNCARRLRPSGAIPSSSQAVASRRAHSPRRLPAPEPPAW